MLHAGLRNALSVRFATQRRAGCRAVRARRACGLAAYSCRFDVVEPRCGGSASSKIGLNIS